MNSFNTIFWKFISLWNTIWSWPLTSNRPARTTVVEMFNTLKKNNIDTVILSKDPRRAMKSAPLLAANPSITDQNRSASSDYNAKAFYPSIMAVSVISQQTKNVHFFKQKNRINKRQVNLLLVCQKPTD